MDTKKLRQKILDLAIRGKLVPQDPNDEPASVLLERIRAEKEQLIKEGKIKRSKKSAATDKSHYENVPFEIPENWCWTTLGEISNYGQCENVDVDKIAANEWILELEDIEKDSGRIIQKLCKDDRKACGTRHKFYRNEILYSKLRTYLNKVLVAPASGFCTSEIIPIHCIETNPWFICFVLRSNYFLDYTASLGYGVKMPRLGTNDALISYIPLPPLSEQARIVDEVAKWNIIIDEIENGKIELESHIKKTKSKILDLAISGKLVPQDPNDEPAIELLKRINPGFKPCDNSHYENMAIPQSWELVSLNSVVDIISGVSYAKSDIKESGVRILRGGNIQDGEIICLEDDVFIDQSYSNMVNSVVKGDIVLVASTGSPTLIGKTGYARITYPDTQIGAFLRIIRPKSSEISAYLNLIFNSDFYKNYIRSLAKGTNINNVKNGYIEQFEIALPPIQEQERIVMMVENIFISLDNITAGLL